VRRVDLAGGGFALVGQHPDVVGDDREALAASPRTSGLDACVEREDVRLGGDPAHPLSDLGDRVEPGDDRAQLPADVADPAHQPVERRQGRRDVAG
jgi:hypothetical protein